MGFTFLAAAISCSWFTSSVMDSRSSGLTFSVAPAAQTASARHLHVPPPRRCAGAGPPAAPPAPHIADLNPQSERGTSHGRSNHGVQPAWHHRPRGTGNAQGPAGAPGSRPGRRPSRGGGTSGGGAGRRAPQGPRDSRMRSWNTQNRVSLGGIEYFPLTMRSFAPSSKGCCRKHSRYRMQPRAWGGRGRGLRRVLGRAPQEGQGWRRHRTPTPDGQWTPGGARPARRPPQPHPTAPGHRRASAELQGRGFVSSQPL